MLRLLSVIAFTLAAAATPAVAEVKYSCSYPKLGIPTCTRLIEGGTLQGTALAQIYRQRADQFAELGELDRAIADYTEAIRHDPDDPHVFQNRAQLLTKKADYAAAIDDWRRVGNLQAPNKTWLLGRGGVYVEMGEYARAIEDFSNALEDYRCEARWLRADAHHRAGNHQRALEDLAEALRGNCGPEEMLYAIRSVIHSGMGARDDAAADLREARRAGAARQRLWPQSTPDPVTQRWLDRAEQQLSAPAPGTRSSP